MKVYNFLKRDHPSPKNFIIENSNPIFQVMADKHNFELQMGGIEMKTINFTCVEVLPALLDHSKVQTIRPAWKEQKSITYKKENKIVGIDFTRRFQIGDEVQLMWHQRTSPKESLFCSHCGKKAPTTDIECAGWSWFKKILGTVKITEVFQIEFMKNPRGGEIGCIVPDGQKWDEIWKRDGFKSGDDLLKWFDEHYDLSKPKIFEVRRWVWQ